jgi:hypothetical protein
MKIIEVKLVDFLSEEEREEIYDMVKMENVTVIINGERMKCFDTVLGQIYAFSYLMNKSLN